MREFEGKKIRDQILAELKEKIALLGPAPTLAVIIVGNNPVSLSYVGLKRKSAKEIGVQYRIYSYNERTVEEKIRREIENLNQDEEVGGIMIQMPLPPGFDRNQLIGAVSPSKDIDGLRYCLGLESKFIPPVILAIEKALNETGVNLAQAAIAIIGRGFLVGGPLYRYFGDSKNIKIFNSLDNKALKFIKKADVIISATGRAGLVQSNMIKEGVILIDAGTSESRGELIGDIDPAAFTKASFYTPVPGGIGPVTIACLMRNLFK